jgi:hypothetical protein
MGTDIELSFAEQIKVLLDRDKLTMTDLANRLDTSRQNLHNKFVRNKFSEQEMEEIAFALGYKFTIKLDKLPSKTK